MHWLHLIQTFVLICIISTVSYSETYAFNLKNVHEAKNGDKNINLGLLGTLIKHVVLDDKFLGEAKYFETSFKDKSKLLSIANDTKNVEKVLKNILGIINTTDPDLAVLNQHLTTRNESLLSKRCTNAMDGLFKDLLSGKFGKIIQMLDAMGKPGSGIYQGNLLWLGSFRECQATDDSHYCLSQLTVVNKYNLMVGLCLPRECSETDTFKILQLISNMTRNVVKADPHNTLQATYGSPAICHKTPSFSAGVIAACTLTAFIAVLVLLATIVDYIRGFSQGEKLVVSKSNGFMPVQNHDDQPLLANNEVEKHFGTTIIDILLCFSMRKNAAVILGTSVPSNGITCLNGIRTLSMFWVILGHTFFFALTSGTDNIVQGFKVIHRFSFQAIANAYFSVDTFFVLSGLLVSYLCLRKFDNFRGFSFMGYFCKKFLPLYYIHRFLRLTPSYMYMILFYIFILPFCGEGPLWFKMQRNAAAEPCKKYWWTNLLYINNFYPTSMGGECVGWSWYLANDMQFYIISPIILLIMYKLQVPGTILINGALCVSSFIITGYIIGHNHLNALLTGDFQGAVAGQQAAHFADWVYSKPYCRIPPYLVGLALGYLLHKRIMPRGTLKYLIGIVGWMNAIIVGFAVTYAPYKVFRQGGKQFTLLENIFYGTFSRFSWGMCVAWVIYACHFGMGGVINTILSWKAFVPLSRLTYCAYLVHPIIIDVFYMSMEKPFHYSDISIVYYFTSFITMTYATAFLLAAFVEFPAMHLEKLAF